MKRFSFALILALMFAACGKDTDSASGEGISGSVLTDFRDGRTYKTVTIGAQTWMAENLNYETANSYCYGDSPANCTKYGRLYTWAAAMDSAGTWSLNGVGCGYKKKCSPTYPVRGVCPKGWHLPTRTEWKTLFAAVGGSSGAGTKLKSTSGWDNNGDGTDVFSFSARPAGFRRPDGKYYYEGRNAYFWSSDEYGDDIAFDSYLRYDLADAYLSYYSNDDGFSVRCLKDDNLGKQSRNRIQSYLGLNARSDGEKD